MITWIPFTPANVLAQFNPSEAAAWQAAQGDVGAVNLGLVCGSVANQIRQAYVEAGRVLDTTPGTIPPGELNRAIALARVKYLLGLPASPEIVSADRMKLHDEAEQWLAALARREIKAPGGVEIARRGSRAQDFDVFGGTGGGR